MEFVKVASDGDVEVLQAMTVLKGKPKSNGDPVDMLTPVGSDAVDDVLVKRVMKALAGRKVTAVSISTSSITARVIRARCPGCDALAGDGHQFCPACGTEL